MGCVNPPVRPGAVYVTHTLTHTYVEEAPMFLRQSSLEDDISSITHTFFCSQTDKHTLCNTLSLYGPYPLNVNGLNKREREREYVRVKPEGGGNSWKCKRSVSHWFC